jgi:hypothetical protein
MTTSVLLVGKLGIVVDDVKSQIQLPDIQLSAATNLAEVRSAFQKAEIQHVIIGAGLDIDLRLEIVRTIFQLSESTTVHMKDVASGPQGFLPFVHAVLKGLHP